MLKRENALLLVIDIQEKLFPHIRRHDELAEAVGRMIRGCGVLGVPVLVTEQYPEGLGKTIASVAGEAGEETPLTKMTFSCCGEESITSAIAGTGRKDVILCGIETHVCVYQTARDLVEEGYRVHLLTDGVSSRRKNDRKTAIARIGSMGVLLCTVEMALFEMLHLSGTDEFRKIIRIVK